SPVVGPPRRLTRSGPGWGLPADRATAVTTAPCEDSGRHGAASRRPSPSRPRPTARGSGAPAACSPVVGPPRRLTPSGPGRGLPADTATAVTTARRGSGRHYTA